MTDAIGKSSPDFVVFDTSTQARWYADVHEALARPVGSILRYEYRRYLCEPTAADAISAMKTVLPKDPVHVLLVYAELNTFKKGDNDPTEMLTWGNSKFIPMRSAKIVNVSVAENSEDSQKDVIHFHMELGGYVNPNLPEFEQVIKQLEANNALPFGDRDTQHTWLSLFPEAANSARDKFVTNDAGYWHSVVDQFITRDTQFADDVFWRVTSFQLTNSYPAKNVKRSVRNTNQAGHATRWDKDYLLEHFGRYEIGVETYVPTGHAQSMPGNASLRISPRDDSEELLRIPARPTDLVPNQKTVARFHVDKTDTIGASFLSLDMETQVPGRESPYPPGSVAQLTFAVEKAKSRLVSGGILFLLTTLFGILAAVFKDQPWLFGTFTTLGAVGAVALVLVMTNQLKLPT